MKNITDKTQACPFRVGDRVRFTPSERTRGLYQDIRSFGIGIGEEVIIREIKDGVYLYFDNDTGGWPWNEFVDASNKEKPES